MQIDDTLKELNEIKVDWLMLADRAEVVGGKLYLMGGGWDRLGLNEIPGPYTFSIATAILVPWNQTNEPHKFEMSIMDEDSTEIVKMEGGFEAGRLPGSRRGHPVRVQLAFGVTLEFKRDGGYVIDGSVNGQLLHQTRFYVVDNSKMPPQLAV